MKILKNKLLKKECKICVIGLGYVGLPVAVSFSKKYQVIGYDIDITRINDLKRSFDKNDSIKKNNLKYLKKIKFNEKIKDLKVVDIFIIATPTPVLKNKKPDLQLVFKALDIFKEVDIKNKLIIVESTVYPEASENEFIPYLEKITKKKINKDFFYGYSPERINPGDKKNNFENIDKIVSGSNNNSLILMKKLYSSVIKKVHVASNIATAEMAKVIENIQRDINIAFVNEVSLISKKFKTESHEVLNSVPLVPMVPAGVFTSKFAGLISLLFNNIPTQLIITSGFMPWTISSNSAVLVTSQIIVFEFNLFR